VRGSRYYPAFLRHAEYLLAAKNSGLRVSSHFVRATGLRRMAEVELSGCRATGSNMWTFNQISRKPENNGGTDQFDDQR
jgi:hypothetical protein